MAKQGMKKETFIKKVNNKFTYIIVLIRGIYAKIKCMHENIKQVTPEKLKSAEPSNPYEMLRNWLTDMFTFGILSTIAINGIFGWQGWYNIGLIIGISLSRHVIPEIIKLISDAIKGK